MPVIYTLNAGNIVELSVFADFQGSKVMNVFHYLLADATGIDPDGNLELKHLITDFEANVWEAALGPWRNRVTSEYTVTGVRAQVVYPVRRYYAQGTFVNPAGTGVPPSCPGDTHIAMNFRTDRVGRGHTGTKKFTGLPLTMFSGADWLAAERTAWQIVGANMAAQMENLIGAFVWRPVVWNPTLPGGFGEITSVTIPSEIRVLRRRQKGVGQ